MLTSTHLYCHDTFAVEDMVSEKKAHKARPKAKKSRKKKSHSTKSKRSKTSRKKKKNRRRKLIKVSSGGPGEPDVYRLTSLSRTQVLRLCDTTDPEDTDRTTDSSPYFSSPRDITSPPPLTRRSPSRTPPATLSTPRQKRSPLSASSLSPNLLSPRHADMALAPVDTPPAAIYVGDAMLNRPIPSPRHAAMAPAPVDTPAVSSADAGAEGSDRDTPATVVDTPSEDSPAAPSSAITPRTPLVVRPPPRRQAVRRSLRNELAQTRLKKSDMIVSASQVTHSNLLPHHCSNLCTDPKL